MTASGNESKKKKETAQKKSSGAPVVCNRLKNLRSKMRKEGIALCLIPTSDDHNSEYVGEYYKVRQFFSGFTGSAGSLLVSLDNAYLFTDGRYFLQAQKELDGTDIVLMKMGEPGVPSLLEFIKEQIPKEAVLGFDGSLITAEFGRKLQKALAEKNAKIAYDFSPEEGIWTDRPQRKNGTAFYLGEEYSGESTESKLAAVRQIMKEKGANAHVLTCLDDIAWLLNVRGSDIENNPVVLSNLVVLENQVIWYAGINEYGQGEGPGKASAEFKKNLTENDIVIFPYEAFLEGMEALENLSVLVDDKNVSIRVWNALERFTKVICATNPTSGMKCIKNDTQRKNLRKVNVEDGVAMTRFHIYLKNEIKNGKVTEYEAAKRIDEYRSKIHDFVDQSFETIAGFGPNGAVIHYAPSADFSEMLKPEGMLLVDSGGHYLRGTTDITRTYALGPVTEEMKHDYTLVLRSFLHVMNLSFPEGVRGANLDLAAREALWKEGVDYRHGTGHGVGYLLNVHEGPGALRWKITANEKELADVSQNAVLKEGMILTDEPGLYRNGKYGIRIENDLLVVKDKETEYGKFLTFEPLTYAPVDLDCVNVEELSEQEAEWLNQYHELVFEKLKDHLEGDELNFLKDYTRKIKKQPISNNEVQNIGQKKCYPCINKDENNDISNIKCFALDMDGTIYLGTKWIEGAKEFLDAVVSSGRKYVFLTNNSSKDPDSYVLKLKNMGLTVTKDQIVTSGEASIDYIKRNYPGKKVFLLGNELLRAEFLAEGIELEEEQPDLVMVGFDTSLNYEKMCKVCDFVRAGLPYLSTHPDYNCPTENGFIPDAGAIHAFIYASANRYPDHIIGKPNGDIMDYLARKAGVSKESTAMVGDRLYTDVAAGVNNGYYGILVLSGEATMKDVEESEVTPSMIFDSVKEMIPYLQKKIKNNKRYPQKLH